MEKHTTLEGSKSTSPGGKRCYRVSSDFLRTELKWPILGTEQTLKRPCKAGARRNMGPKTIAERIRSCTKVGQTQTSSSPGVVRPDLHQQLINHPERYSGTHKSSLSHGSQEQEHGTGWLAFASTILTDPRLYMEVKVLGKLPKI